MCFVNRAWHCPVQCARWQGGLPQARAAHMQQLRGGERPVSRVQCHHAPRRRARHHREHVVNIRQGVAQRVQGTLLPNVHEVDEPLNRHRGRGAACVHDIGRTPVRVWLGEYVTRLRLCCACELLHGRAMCPCIYLERPYPCVHDLWCKPQNTAY